MQQLHSDGGGDGIVGGASAIAGVGQVGVRRAPAVGLRLHTFASLRHRDFRYLWLAQWFSSGGMWIETITKSWLVYQMTDSPLLLGAVNGLRALPFLFVSPLAGVIIDRVDRKLVMAASQSINLLVALLMGILVAMGLIQVWHIFVLSLVAGVGWSFNQPARQSMVPNLVPRQDLMNAIALNSTAFNATRVVGPMVGGFLIAGVGIAGNFFVQSAMYIGVLTMVAMMRVPPTPPTARRASMQANLMEGLNYVRHNQTVLALVAMGLIPALFAMPYMSLMPIFAKDVLQIGPAGFGILMAAVGTGAVISTLILASLGDFRYKGIVMLGAAVSLGLAMMVFSQSKFLPLTLAFLLVTGFSQQAYHSTNHTVLQVVVPDELRGRVWSIYMLDHGLMPLGTLVAGAAATFIGAPHTVTIMGACVTALAIIAAMCYPIIRRLR